MEVSVAVLFEAKDKAQADFIYSMWDVETQPLDDEVEQQHKALYSEIEFADEPDVFDRLSDTKLVAFYDVLSGMDALDDVVGPYLGQGLKNIVFVMAADEGNEWLKLSGDKMAYFTPKAHAEDDDIVEAVKLVGNYLAT